MTGQAVGCHHPDPTIHGGDGCFRIEPKPAQAMNFAQRVWMVKYQQILPDFALIVQIDLTQALLHLLLKRGIESWLNQQPAERVDVATHDLSTKESRLKNSRATPHERIIYPIPLTAEALDKKTGKLRLETGPIGYLMQGMRRPLPGCPELVCKKGNRTSSGTFNLRKNRGGTHSAEPVNLLNEGMATGKIQLHLSNHAFINRLIELHARQFNRTRGMFLNFVCQHFWLDSQHPLCSAIAMISALHP
ncbi:MAG: hypothetical protein BWY82_02147 [Verrucomicrobia bacterium ADurb.Bin474]|nr:MAG: hypothetical protein BWY82_02147 [Verrucomicrobia bacterium ADurb.Bin474]